MIHFDVLVTLTGAISKPFWYRGVKNRFICSFDINATGTYINWFKKYQIVNKNA